MVIVTTAVYWGLNSQLRPKRLTNPLNLPAPGGVSPYTSSYDFARTCVFDKQSLPLVSATHTRSGSKCPSRSRSPSPEVTGHFAEFLNHDSLDRLSILYLITCVGLGYGRLKPSRRCFSRQHGITKSPKQGPITSQAQAGAFNNRQPYTLRPRQPSRGLATFLRHTC